MRGVSDFRVDGQVRGENTYEFVAKFAVALILLSLDAGHQLCELIIKRAF